MVFLSPFISLNNFIPSPSIIYSLLSMGCKKVLLSNRTIEKAEEIKKKFHEVEILKWGEIPDFDIVINGTSVGVLLVLLTPNKIISDLIISSNELPSS